MIKYLFIFLFLPSVLFAEIENARDLMEEGKFKEAMEELMPAARSGNACLLYTSPSPRDS